jgi:hypothetical protein
MGEIIDNLWRGRRKCSAKPRFLKTRWHVFPCFRPDSSPFSVRRSRYLPTKDSKAQQQKLPVFYRTRARIQYKNTTKNKIVHETLRVHFEKTENGI